MAWRKKMRGYVGACQACNRPIGSGDVCYFNASAEQGRRLRCEPCGSEYHHDEELARLAAAQLRVLACSQDQLAAGYSRQMDAPIYAGQEMVCSGKAENAAAYAARTRAQADLIEAEAGL